MLPGIVNSTLKIYQLSPDLEEEAKDPPEREKLYDFIKNDFVLQGGDPVDLQKRRDIVKQWIKKVFATQKKRWRIYEGEEGVPFGIGIEDYIGQTVYSSEVSRDMFKKDIKDTLELHRWIDRIDELMVLQVEDKMYIQFWVKLKGEEKFMMEEVV